MRDDINQLLADAARDLAEEPTFVTTLERTVELCTQAVEHCEVAGVALVESHEIRTLAATGPALRRVDELQLRLREGPCYGALRKHETLVSDDLSVDPRWPRWGPGVVDELGLRSAVSLRLFATRDVPCALSLYAASERAFGPDAVVRAQALAAQASVGLAATFKESQLHRALETRTVIGQATGILIERFGLTPDQAFALMRRVSQNLNIKVHALAEHLVETGVLLDRGRPDPDHDETSPSPTG
jgi:hypothetical protein